MKKNLLIALAPAALFAQSAAAELELSFYLGIQGVQDSSVSGVLPDGTPFNRSINWEGRSFEAPFYYGGRAIWWLDNNIGFGIEGTHAKAYAPDAEAATIGLSRFELSDGHNIFTANVMKRWPGAIADGLFTPYIGGGIGIAVPHVDALVTGATDRTYDFEATGPALRGLAGLKYNITEDWALFGEYQFTWSDNDITIDADPAVPGQPSGTLKTDLITHAFNFGISYSF
ncbi:MAG: outer membrane beta-barrel protein [Pseudomonadota bacterium]